MRAPVGSMPLNGSPVNVPLPRHCTAARRSSATMLSMVTSRSGDTAYVPRAFSRISSRPRRIPSGTMSSTPSSLQFAATVSKSRALNASIVLRATSSAVGALDLVFVAMRPEP